MKITEPDDQTCPPLAAAQLHTEEAARLALAAGQPDLSAQLERLAELLGWEATRNCTCRSREASR